MKYQRPKGTEDLYSHEVTVFNNIINRLVSVAKFFNYQEIITPVFESADLFLRTIGVTTNIVEKEIYQFVDKSNRTLALRPEGTAGVIRAVVENKLYSNQKQMQKYFYYGKMYRYENPQKGRNREFHQFGVEVLQAKHPLVDVEVIIAANSMLEKLTIKNTVLNLNYFGSQETKEIFSSELSLQLLNQKDKLCQNCQEKINKNPLRVLDCKVCSLLSLKIPLIKDFYTPQENEYFQEIINTLSTIGINFKINPNLVRGLDYYNGVVFEFISNSDILGKSQNTLIGGGRYDNLCQQIGVPYSYPAVGFAFGIERLILLLKDNPEFNVSSNLNLFVASQYEKGMSQIFFLITKLRAKDKLVDGIFELFNDKQKNNLVKNIKNSDNLLILAKENQAILYQLNKQEKVVVEYKNQEELLEKLLHFLNLKS